MSFIYSLFSILTLYPLFIWVRKLSSSHYPYTRFGAIAVIVAFMVFHLHIFHMKAIPILGISVPEDNEFMSYAPYFFGLLVTFVSMAAFNSKGK